MKKFRAIFAMLTAIIMAFGMSPIALAAEGEAANGNRTSDTSISVTGLQNSDKVSYYQVVKWVDGEGWALAEGFDGLTDPSLEVITNKDTQLTQEQASNIAALANSATAKDTDMPVANGTWSVDKPAPGLYMVIVTAGTSGVIYNPVFVAADYEAGGTNTISIEEKYGSNGISKKESVTVDKTAAEGTTDNNVGDDVDFTITTTIPVYLDSYTNPSFKITDAVTDGLVIDPTTVKVKYGDEEATETNSDLELTLTTDENDNTITNGITVNFKSDYLGRNVVPVSVKVTYKAKVTNAATYNVNQDKNEVTVEYSNGPGEEKGAVKDATTHYTFSIGALLLGKNTEQDKTTIIRKVKLDENGNYVIATETVDSEPRDTKASALPGAKFTLYTNEDCTNDHVYKNALYPGGAVVQSDDNGLITINGLDAGTYWLKETDAPDGYIKEETKHKIEIEATYDDVELTEKIFDKDVPYTVKVLKSYTVKYDGEPKSSYEFTNEGSTIKVKEETVQDEPSFIVNNAGTELPSTGGIGTTIFYVVGGVMVAGAAIFLLTKRRANTAE